MAPHRNSHFYTNALALYSDTSPSAPVFADGLLRLADPAQTCSAEVPPAVRRASCPPIGPAGRRRYRHWDGGATKNLAVDCRGTNCTHAGEVIWSTCPVGVRRPVLGWMRKTTTLSDCWFAANNQEPVGSTAKLRGVFPFVETTSTLVSVPFIGSIEKTAMLSCPRFEA